MVLSAKLFPELTAQPAWERGSGGAEDPFPWLSKLEASAGLIASELRAVCDAELPDGSYCLGSENRRAMAHYSGLTDTESSIYTPGFDDQPTNGYVHTVPAIYPLLPASGLPHHN